MIDRTSLALCTIGIIGGVAVLMILGVLWSVRYGSLRAGLAAIMRTVGRPVLRWLERGGSDDR
ncbi:hypothetical protein [Kutzneria buriramensis]|uniref:Uncharacterized protein n=1 Tax=Kutzneria buriramensis TaxID=1045776 RepID=A0A3E0HPC5_9PSEU|nr:hypothetical protein [Kutzneria buriramensis]REH48294.1 hypothetical protein BCF44_105152 [Kutzneria buriramensis]